MSFLRKLRKSIASIKGHPTPTAPPPEESNINFPTPWPLQDHAQNPIVTDQLQSPLFGKLSAELRLEIYKRVLGDPDRLLHICLNDTQRSRRRVAHWRCTDLESPYPTWQHTCFGEEKVILDNCKTVTSRRNTTTEDHLVALLLSCRRVYSEALAILYENNVFHFRGGLGLPAFKHSIPTAQWHLIRHIHISTTYSSFYSGNLRMGARLSAYLPPKSLPDWSILCEALTDLPNLQSLCFDIIVNDQHISYDYYENKAGMLMSILGPLKPVRAQVVEVELDVEVPEEVWEAAGLGNAVMVCKKRPYNEEVYRWHDVHDSIDFDAQDLHNYLNPELLR